MSIAAEIQTCMRAAAAAISGGDYATAKSQAEAAMALVCSIPDGGSQGASMTWSRQSIAQFIARCDRARASAGGIRRTRVEYVNPGDDGSYS